MRVVIFQALSKLVFVILLVHLGLCSTCSDMYPGFTSYVQNESMCFAVMASQVTAVSAGALCASVGMKLPNIHNNEDNDLLVDLCSSIDSCQGTDGTSIWIGLFAADGVWTWGDGTTTDYFDWSAEQLNSEGDGKYCVELSTGGKWSKQPCTSVTRYYSCQGTVSMPVTSSPTTTCFGTNSEDENVCSGHGVCPSLDKCDCSTNYFGSNCEESYPSFQSSSSNIKCQRCGYYDKSNGNWSSQFLVNDVQTSNTQLVAGVTDDPFRGGFAVAYFSYVSGSTDLYDIYLQFYDATSTKRERKKVKSNLNLPVISYGWHESASLATLPGVGFVLCYTHLGGTNNRYNVHCMILDYFGSVKVPEFQCYPDKFTTNYNNWNPGVAVLNDGSFIVMWVYEYAYQSSGKSGSSHNFRRYGSDGKPIGSYTYYSYQTYKRVSFYRYTNFVSSPDTFYSDDNYVIPQYQSMKMYTGTSLSTYTSTSYQGTPRLFTFDVHDFGSWNQNIRSFRIGKTPSNRKVASQITSLDDGTYIFTWYTKGSTNSYVYVQRYKNDGTKIGSALTVSYSAHFSKNLDPAVASLGDGSFIVVGVGQGNDRRGSFIWVRAFDKNNYLLFYFSDVHGGNYFCISPDVIVNEDGSFFVTYQVWNLDYSKTWGIYGRFITSTGSAIASPFRINSYTSYDQEDVQLARVALCAQPTSQNPIYGGFVAVWNDASYDTSGWGVFGKQFKSPRSCTWQCYGTLNTVSSVCGGSSQGTCTETDKCTCKSGYCGKECKGFVCGEVCSVDTGVKASAICSGHGSCVSSQKCQCDEGYENENDVYCTLGAEEGDNSAAITLAVVGGVVVGVVVLICICICIIAIVAVVLFVLFGCGLLSTGSLTGGVGGGIVGLFGVKKGIESMDEIESFNDISLEDDDPLGIQKQAENNENATESAAEADSEASSTSSFPVDGSTDSSPSENADGVSPNAPVPSLPIPNMPSISENVNVGVNVEVGNDRNLVIDDVLIEESDEYNPTLQLGAHMKPLSKPSELKEQSEEDVVSFPSPVFKFKGMPTPLDYSGMNENIFNQSEESGGSFFMRPNANHMVQLNALNGFAEKIAGENEEGSDTDKTESSDSSEVKENSEESESDVIHSSTSSSIEEEHEENEAAQPALTPVLEEEEAVHVKKKTKKDIVKKEVLFSKPKEKIETHVKKNIKKSKVVFPSNEKETAVKPVTKKVKKSKAVAKKKVKKNIVSSAVVPKKKKKDRDVWYTIIEAKKLAESKGYQLVLNKRDQKYYFIQKISLNQTKIIGRVKIKK